MSSSVSHLYFCTGELCTGCNRKHSSYAFHSTELKDEKKTRLLQAVKWLFFISHSSAIPLYLDVVIVTFKCLFGRSVYSMEHDDCNSDFVQVEA